MKFLACVLLFLPFAAFSQAVQQCAAVVENGYWKTIDGHGNVLNDSHRQFSDKETSYWNFVTDGRERVGNNRSGWGDCLISEGMMLFIENGKICFRNWKNEIIVHAAYTNVSLFRNGCAAVCTGRSWGMVNNRGKMIVDTIYDYVADADASGAVVVEKNGRLALIDTTGRMILPFYYRSFRRLMKPEFNEGLLYALSPVSDKTGFINTKGKLVIDTIYSMNGAVSDYHDQRGLCGTTAIAHEKIYSSYKAGDYYRFEGGRCLVSAPGKKIVIDSKGNEVYTFTRYFRNTMNSHGFFIVYAEPDGRPGNELGGCGVYDPKGKIIIPFDYSYVTSMRDNCFHVQPTQFDDFYVDTKGKKLFGTSFYRACDFGNGLAFVTLPESKNYAQCVLTRSGKLIPIEKDKAMQGSAWVQNPDGGPIPLSPGGWPALWGYADRDFRWVVKPQYEDAKVFSNGYAAVMLKGKWGYINTKGELVIECRYDQVLPFQTVKI
jgi:WG containing repeat